MAPNWSDDPVDSNTHIRVDHINELRRAVDNYRHVIGMPRGGWTNDPVTTSTPIRAVHFIELRSAIQALRDFQHQGPLPSWTAGTAPSSARQVRALDMNDRRAWFDGVTPGDPVIGINVDADNDAANPPAETILAANFQGIRLTARSSDKNKNYISRALEFGLKVVAIVATPNDSDFDPENSNVILQI